MRGRNYIGIGIALGAGIGTAIGVAMNNIALWLAIGIGTAIGSGIYQQHKNNANIETATHANKRNT